MGALGSAETNDLRHAMTPTAPGEADGTSDGMCGTAGMEQETQVGRTTSRMGARAKRWPRRRMRNGADRTTARRCEVRDG
jgi:hypothetical protein